MYINIHRILSEDLPRSFDDYINYLEMTNSDWIKRMF